MNLHAPLSLKENWYAALALALSLPDIAASLEADNGKTDGARYAAWFNQWLPQYSQPQSFQAGPRLVEWPPFMVGSDCYALRCAFLHTGVDDIEKQRAQKAIKRFLFMARGGGIAFHCAAFNDYLQLDVSRFVEEICEAVVNWRSDFIGRQPQAIERESALMVIYDASTMRSIVRDAMGGLSIDASAAKS